nr:DMT family transporter [uncultured Cohaesibacter sp.]
MSSDTKGIILRIASTLFFTITMLFIKFLAGEIPTGQIVFFRSAFALLPLVLLLMMTKEFPAGLRTARPMGHVTRCLLGCIAMFTSFAALKYLPIAHSTLIGYLAPIISVLLARALLKEQVTPVRIAGIGLGFSGMLVLILPDLTAIHTDHGYLVGVALGLVTAILTAGARIQVRRLTATENPAAIAFYFALTCTLAGLLTLPLGWVMPDGRQLMLLIGCGVAGGIAQIMMTLSYKLGEVSKLATFEYLSLAFAVVADFLFFAIVPEPNFYLSSALVVGATLIVAFRDRSHARRQKADANAPV